MNLIAAIEILSAAVGLALSIVLVAFPRFGRASGMLVLFLVSSLLAAGLPGAGPLLGVSPSESIVFSFACLILSGTTGCLASGVLKREDYTSRRKKGWWLFAIFLAIGPVLVAALPLFVPGSPEISDGLETMVPLGSIGFAAALYLLLVSVIALANVEQTLRGAEEHVRWEIKFLLLGLACAFGALVYVASQILLYRPESSFLSSQTIRIFPITFLCSCLLILQSWRRASGRAHFSVSQGVIYSTITFFSVGAYLVASSLVSSWASQWSQTDLPTGAVISLLSFVALSILFLATAFRHRAKVWIRRNLFAGRYDYRQFWMDATEQVRSSEAPEFAAAALVKLIQKALGSLDLSLWVRSRNSDSVRLIAAQGVISHELPLEFPGFVHHFGGITRPVAVGELAPHLVAELPAGFLTQTKAAILAPLVSSGRLVGILTVGSDRSGKPFDWETREFLRVIAVHFANELHKAELLSKHVEAREAEAFQTFSTFLLHDLKNFASTLSLIAKNGARLRGNPDFQADAFKSVFDISEKMKRLCNNLRTFSTAPAPYKVLDDLNRITRDFAEAFEANSGRSLQLDLGAIPEIAVDREEMTRMLRNLVLNAVEASPEGGAIKVSTSYDAQRILLSVADRGKGISKEFLEKALFQPFQTTKSDGLGIGLFQSKKIVEAHDGTIEIESTEGVGTVVRVVLPIPEVFREPDKDRKQTQRTPAAQEQEAAINFSQLPVPTKPQS